MNTSEINKALSKVNFFRGTFACDDIPKPIPGYDQSFVVNTDTCREEGEHWVAIVLLKDGTGEYFDSFGMPILVQRILEYMRKHCPVGYALSNRMIQSPLSWSCGNFCVDFIRKRSLNINLYAYLRGFSDEDLSANELKVSEICPRTWLRRPGRI